MLTVSLPDIVTIMACVCECVISLVPTVAVRRWLHCYETTNCTLPTPATHAVCCAEMARPSTCLTITSQKTCQSRNALWRPAVGSPATVVSTADLTCLVRWVQELQLFCPSFVVSTPFISSLLRALCGLFFGIDLGVYCRNVCRFFDI